MYARDFALIATPVGIVRVEGDDRFVQRIEIATEGTAIRGNADTVRNAAEQIERYFAGELRAFKLPLAPPATPRGQVLRDAIVAVPFGSTRHYGEIADGIGSSARAIGQACRRNPFPIVVPCHRVVGGAGHYSAGRGIDTKNQLLAHERHHEDLRHG